MGVQPTIWGDTLIGDWTLQLLSVSLYFTLSDLPNLIFLSSSFDLCHLFPSPYQRVNLQAGRPVQQGNPPGSPADGPRGSPRRSLQGLRDSLHRGHRGNRQVNHLENLLGNPVVNQRLDRLNLRVSLLANQRGNLPASRLDSQVANQLANQHVNLPDNQLDSQLDSPLGNLLDSLLVNQLDNQLDSPLGNQLDSQLDSQLGNLLDNQLGSQRHNRQGSRQGNPLRGHQRRPGSLLRNLRYLPDSLQHNRQYQHRSLLQNRRSDPAVNRQPDHHHNLRANRRVNPLPNRHRYPPVSRLVSLRRGHRFRLVQII